MKIRCPHCGQKPNLNKPRVTVGSHCPACSSPIRVVSAHQPKPWRFYRFVAILLSAGTGHILSSPLTQKTSITHTKPATEEPAAQTPSRPIDFIAFGENSSELAHGFKNDKSEVIRGGLEQPARRLLPGGNFPWQGGSLEWTMNVDPKLQNYLTVKLWGSDHGTESGRLVLFANGLQVGYRLESDYDILNQCEEEPQAPGRFLYVTLPLPPMLTEGKSNLTLKILSTGPVWYYGETYDKYQKPLSHASRGIYRAYSHTQPRWVPDAAERQGLTPHASLRPSTGPEVIANSKQVVISKIAGILKNKSFSANFKVRNSDLLVLSEAYQTAWTPAHQNRRAIEKILCIGDAMAADFAKDQTYINAEWVGAGALGQAILRTWSDISHDLDVSIELNQKTMPRRKAWLPMLKYSVDYWRTHRRSYTNQSLIVDTGIYAANRALELIDPPSAIPEARALDFLYQSSGAKPWLGSDTADGGSEAPYGKNYSLITRKGLSRELGYVGSYGETILPFTCDLAWLTGDRTLREQARKIQHARMAFRYPAVDDAGYRCMKLASEIDNRTAHYPHPGSAYNAPAIRESWWLETASLLTDDPAIVGAAQQSIEEGQYFHYIESRLNDADILGMMRNVNQWDIVSHLPKSTRRLPMTPGQPDFIFADEENGVLAIKHGDTILYVNLYYRAERAVNRVARVFELTPQITRIATVRTDVETIASGETYQRPDWIDRIRRKGFMPPGQNLHQAWAGEVMPISKRPDDAPSPQYGDWGPFLGKAAFYQLRYGNYLIGMNTTETQTYALRVPSGTSQAVDLVSGKLVELSGSLSIPPLTTVVLDLKNP